MHVPRLLCLLVTATSLLLVFGSCGGGDDDIPDFPTVVTLGEGEVFPSILNSSLGVGENRISWHLIDKEDNPIYDAAINIRYFNLNADEPAFSSEASARPVRTETSFIDENNGRERTVTGETGVYVTYTSFDEAGDWGAELTIADGEDEHMATYRFNVLEDTIEPGIGDPAPATMQATTATEPVEEIDSSYPPRPAMHDTTVADALETGMPVVIAFATPAFCTSRTCGPVMDNVVVPLAERYAEEAMFIHIEPYLLRDLREANVRSPVPAALEWRLQSEPWVFVVGRDGRIAGRFEGIVDIGEVESVLQLALAEVEPAAATPVGTP